MSARRQRLVLAPNAANDLSDILLYTQQQWVNTQRAAYKALIDRTLRELTQFPGLGRRRDEIAPDLRSHPVGRQLISYQVSDDELIVTRIVHGRRDIEDETGFMPT